MPDATIAPIAIEIDYKPRNWARALHASMRRFFAVVLHRRAGKTTAVINHHQRYAMDDALERKRLLTLRPELTAAEVQELIRPPGGRHYGHIMPLRTQAKLVVWDKLKYYARPIPGIKINESELLIRYPTGHKFQLFGADDPDTLRGPAFSGVSFDEFSQMPGNIYSESISKALADHLGYALFLGTIKGKDQLFQTYQAAKDSADWFSLWQDVDRSLATEEGITIQLLEQAMADDRKQIALGLMTQDEYDQEWFLSSDAAIKGAWFLKEMAKAKAENRITRVPVDQMLTVDTDWDLGIADSMAIWFSQSLRSGEVRLVDYYEATGEGFPHFIGLLKEKGYVYGKHYPPHDIAVRELGSGKSRKEIAAGLGLRFEEPITPAPEFADGINAARLLLAQCWFDEQRCAKGIECLRQYRKAFNTRLDEFTGTPVHNWASHGADAFRGLAVRYKAPSERRKPVTSGRPPLRGDMAWAG
jgi:hypothetical protein